MTHGGTLVHVHLKGCVDHRIFDQSRIRSSGRLQATGKAAMKSTNPTQSCLRCGRRSGLTCRRYQWRRRYYSGVKLRHSRELVISKDEVSQWCLNRSGSRPESALMPQCMRSTIWEARQSRQQPIILLARGDCIAAWQDYAKQRCCQGFDSALLGRRHLPSLKLVRRLRYSPPGAHGPPGANCFAQG